MIQGIHSTPLQKKEQSTTDLQPLLQRQFQQIFSKDPTLSLDQAFYIQATKLHIQAIQKIEKVRGVKEEIDKLNKQLGIQHLYNRRIQASYHIPQSQSNNESRKKRMRRTAVQIARHYVCTIDKCNKSYGSEGSLNQHMKIKHRIHYQSKLPTFDIKRNDGQSSHPN